MRNNVIAKAAKPLIALVVLSLVFCIGAYFGQTTSGFQTNRDTDAYMNTINTGLSPTVVETRTVQYMDSPVTDVKYVDKVETVPVELLEFNNHEELKQWEATEPVVLTLQNKNVSSVESVTSVNNTVVVKNPTFQEVRDFILKDPTSRNTFLLNKYECRHFATDVNNNAEAAGLRCAFVLLCYKNGQHAVVAFDTTDRGMIYIEPQTDAAIQSEVGGKYQGEEIIEILISW